MSPGSHQTRMCQIVMPEILTLLPSSFWNPKLWSTPALPMPAWNLAPLTVRVCASTALKRIFAPITCRHLHTHGLDTSCTISAVLGARPSFLSSGLALSRFLRSLTCIQKRFSNTLVDFFYPLISLTQNNNTLGPERWLSSREH